MTLSTILQACTLIYLNRLPHRSIMYFPFTYATDEIRYSTQIILPLKSLKSFRLHYYVTACDSVLSYIHTLTLSAT